jgi:hypothetical protein
VAEITILEFLEDIGQQRFLEGLIARLAGEMGLTVHLLEPGNATGGRSRVLTELRQFLRDLKVGQKPTPDLMVIAIDANCRGDEARSDIQKVIQHAGYIGSYVMAVPKPHIECWYLADPQGFQQRFGGELQKTPRGKCEKDLYKRLLARAFAAARVGAPLGGAEYGAEVAESIDLYRAGHNVTAFKRFLDDLRQVLIACARAGDNGESEL